MAVNSSDVQVTLGRTLTSQQHAQAAMWIGQATALIAARATLHGLALSELDPDILDMVITEAVANRLKRPDDATEVTVQHDDTQVSRRYESSTGQIEILDQWWALLFPATAGAGGAFTIPLHYHRHGSGHHHHAGLHDAW